MGHIIYFSCSSSQGTNPFAVLVQICKSRVVKFQNATWLSLSYQPLRGHMLYGRVKLLQDEDKKLNKKRNTATPTTTMSTTRKSQSCKSSLGVSSSSVSTVVTPYHSIVSDFSVQCNKMPMKLSLHHLGNQIRKQCTVLGSFLNALIQFSP